MSHTHRCPVCEQGNLQAHVEKIQVEYGGRNGQIDSAYSVCDACGAEQASAAQLRHNKRVMMAFKKQVDGLMTGTQVRALRESLGINQGQAAQIFGGGPVAFSKYESDDVAQSEAMDKLLRTSAMFPEAFAMLAQEAGVALRT